MDELRVPTVALEAHLRYFDERLLTGRIFVPPQAQRHEGPMRPEEWMNQQALFFPFVADGERKARILNKRYVVVLTLLDPPEGPEALSRRRVSIECGSLHIEGDVQIDMPEHASRLLDWVNRPERFLVVHEGGQRHIIQKNRITSLAEVVED